MLNVSKWLGMDSRLRGNDEHIKRAVRLGATVSILTFWRLKNHECYR
jgi:hypothetical protein